MVFLNTGHNHSVKNQHHTFSQYAYVCGQNVKWFVEIKHIANFKKVHSHFLLLNNIHAVTKFD